MRKSIGAACAVALAATVAAGAAEAQSRRAQRAQAAEETGVAQIHQLVKVGRKTCMLDHFHDGSGNGRTRKDAERAAITAWADFTAWEYGSPWARFQLAESKGMNCSQSGAGWSCALQARPCRPY